MSRQLAPRAIAVASVSLLALAAACKSDRANISDPVGRVYNARFATVGANLPRGSATFGATDITINLAGLESLGTGAYHVWLAFQDANGVGSITPAYGDLVVTRTDTTINAQGDPEPVVSSHTVPNTSSFTEGGTSRVQFDLTVNATTLAAGGAAITNPATFNLVFVTIEPNAAATAPSDSAPHPLWQYDTESKLHFGIWTPSPSTRYDFQVAGRGIVGVWDKVLVVDDSALTRPPKGYFYATVLRRTVPTPTTANPDSVEIQAVYLGPQKAPYPHRDISLLDADVDNTAGGVVVVSPPSITAASERVQIDTVTGAVLPNSGTQPFMLYRNVEVTLEPKRGIEAPSQTVILSAALPDVVTKAP